MALEKFYVPDYYGELDDNMLDKTKRHNTTLMKAYPYSNENLIGLFKNLKVNNASVLTVGSSGDQLLNALYYGSKDITVMDANLYTKHWIDYKIAAIKNLSFEQFLQYFFDGFAKGEMFCWECYSQFFHDLPEDSQAFWGTIFADPNLTPLHIFMNIIGRKDAGTIYATSDFYDTHIAYKRLASILKKGDYHFDVINAEFNEFEDCIGDRKYDVILLSNIADYIPVSKYVPIVNSLYNNVLSPGGQIQVGYSFGSARSVREFFLSKYPKVINFMCGHSSTLLAKPEVAEIKQEDSSSMDRS